MARPREFNTQTAIDQALSVFRTQGYKGSSLQDLITAMGISKSSFYEAFGSKYELFLLSLIRFHETEAIFQFIDTNIDNSAKTLLTDIFRQLIHDVTLGKGGCMFGNCAVEFSNTDLEVTTRIAHGIQQVEQMFYQILNCAQKNGEISATHGIRDSAKQLTATFYGLQVMAKANMDQVVLNEIASKAVAMLDKKNLPIKDQPVQYRR